MSAAERVAALELFELAALAGLGSFPESAESRAMLDCVRDCLADELAETGTIDDDRVCELAESCVPVYSWPLAQALAGLGGPSVAADDLGDHYPDGVPLDDVIGDRLAAVVCSIVCERLARAILEKVAE